MLQRETYDIGRTGFMDLRNDIPTSKQLKPICQLFSAAVLVDASADVNHWASWTCLKIADPIVLHGGLFRACNNSAPF